MHSSQTLSALSSPSSSTKAKDSQLTFEPRPWPWKAWLWLRIRLSAESHQSQIASSSVLSIEPSRIIDSKGKCKDEGCNRRGTLEDIEMFQSQCLTTWAYSTELRGALKINSRNAQVDQSLGKPSGRNAIDLSRAIKSYPSGNDSTDREWPDRLLPTKWKCQCSIASLLSLWNPISQPLKRCKANEQTVWGKLFFIHTDLSEQRFIWEEKSERGEMDSTELYTLQLGSRYVVQDQFQISQIDFAHARRFGSSWKKTPNANLIQCKQGISEKRPAVPL